MFECAFVRVWFVWLASCVLLPATLLAGSGQADAPAAARAAAKPAWLDAYRAPAARLIEAATADDAAWQRLAELTDTFGSRLSGSKAYELAIAWAVDRMRADGLEHVRAEPVKVPHWVRGHESLEILDPVERPLPLLGLGGSVATSAEGVIAEMMVVSSFDELDARAAEARGRIVVYDVPFTTYGETVRYRGAGASRAARHGAVAALVRSVGPVGLRTLHTGAMRYDPAFPSIPVAAITAEDAGMLHRIAKRGRPVRLRLTMASHFADEADSANVIGEIRGREHPDEVMVVACHLDSWDVGTGASDDAVGCIGVWEAVRLMKQLDLRPRRTVRVVLYANEENGLRGGTTYRDAHREELAKHVAMLEMDLGAFPPVHFGFSGSDGARATVEAIASLLEPIDAQRVRPGGGGADIGPSVQAAGIPALSLTGDAEQYFMIHHTPADTIDRIQPRDVARAAAAIAVMAYVIADLPERLDRAAGTGAP